MASNLTQNSEDHLTMSEKEQTESQSDAATASNEACVALMELFLKRSLNQPVPDKFQVMPLESMAELRASAELSQGYEIVEGVIQVSGALEDTRKQLFETRCTLQKTKETYESQQLEIEKLSKIPLFTHYKSPEYASNRVHELRNAISLFWGICATQLLNQAHSLSNALSQEVRSEIAQLKYGVIGKAQLRKYKSLLKQLHDARDANRSSLAETAPYKRSGDASSNRVHTPVTFMGSFPPEHLGLNKVEPTHLCFNKVDGEPTHREPTHLSFNEVNEMGPTYPGFDEVGQTHVNELERVADCNPISEQVVDVDPQAVSLAPQRSPCWGPDPPRTPEKDEDIVHEIIQRQNEESTKAPIARCGAEAVLLSATQLHTAGAFESELNTADMFPTDSRKCKSQMAERGDEVPVYLPLHVERRVLAPLRTGLAHALYVYMQRAMPTTLKTEGWEDWDGSAASSMLQNVLDKRVGVDDSKSRFASLVAGRDEWKIEEGPPQMSVEAMVRIVKLSMGLADRLGLGTEGEPLGRLGEGLEEGLEKYMGRRSAFRARMKQKMGGLERAREEINREVEKQEKVLMGIRQARTEIEREEGNQMSMFKAEQMKDEEDAIFELTTATRDVEDAFLPAYFRKCRHY